MKQKILATILCMIALFVILPTTASADMGPKPSVVINFEGLKNKIYYVTLLSETSSTGPYSVVNPEQNNIRQNKGQDIISNEEMKAWEAFAYYQDTDSYYFLGYFQNCTETKQFVWGYHPPTKFKIVVYMPKEDRLIVSEKIYKAYAFDSYFTAKITKTEIVGASEDKFNMSIVKSYDYTQEIVSFIGRVAATIAVELFIAFLFGLRKKKQIMLIVKVNIITQTILNILLSVIGYHQGSMMFGIHYFWMEFIVFAIETKAYSKAWKKDLEDTVMRKWMPATYAFCANTISFFIGIYMSHLIPGLF